MTFDPVKCEQLARKLDEDHALYMAVIKDHDGVVDASDAPIIAEQLRAAVIEVAALNGVVDTANARVTTLTIAIRATATAARKAGLRATAELLQGLVDE